MTKRLILASVGAAAILAFASMANASGISNGGFELGSPNAALFQTIGAGNSTTITDWTVGGSSIDWIHGYWEGSSGSLLDKSVDLSGNQHGSISQVISDLVSGQWYKLSFDTALNPDEIPGPAISQSLSWSLGAQNGVATGTTHPNTAWTSFDFLFQWAGASTATLLFATTVSPNNCCYGPALDNVALEAVPLPAALPLFAAGLGIMGYFGSRRRRKAALAA